MDKVTKEKIDKIKLRHAKASAILFKSGLCFGLITGCAIGYCVRKKLMSEDLCSAEDRLFYKERFTEIKNALLQIKAHHLESKTTI
ncbi:MAG TPA: hypothetical protein DCS67_12290 [Clostridiales bacterium UBA8960]|nr:hypothetical protein [Clostridiales bacterium UBA8960]